MTKEDTKVWVTTYCLLSLHINFDWMLVLLLRSHVIQRNHMILCKTTCSDIKGLLLIHSDTYIQHVHVSYLTAPFRVSYTCIVSVLALYMYIVRYLSLNFQDIYNSAVGPWLHCQAYTCIYLIGKITVHTYIHLLACIIIENSHAQCPKKGGAILGQLFWAFGHHLGCSTISPWHYWA